MVRRRFDHLIEQLPRFREKRGGCFRLGAMKRTDSVCREPHDPPAERQRPVPGGTQGIQMHDDLDGDRGE